MISKYKEAEHISVLTVPLREYGIYINDPS